MTRALPVRTSDSHPITLSRVLSLQGVGLLAVLQSAPQSAVAIVSLQFRRICRALLLPW